MSMNNIVIIKKDDDGKFRGYHRDYDAWLEGQYDYEGPCQFCNGDNPNCCCGGTGYYTPPKEDPVFEVDTMEGSIHAYYKWLDEMNNNEDGFPFCVEYGYEFVGLKPDEFVELKPGEFAEHKQLKKALNKHFCTERNHQKKFLGPGVHSRHVNDPTTLGGGGCIYCNMMRLEMEVEKLREIVEKGNEKLKQLNEKLKEKK